MMPLLNLTHSHTLLITSSLVFTFPLFLLGVGVFGCFAQPGLTLTMKTQNKEGYVLHRKKDVELIIT